MSIMKRTKQEGGRDAVKVKVEHGRIFQFQSISGQNNISLISAKPNAELAMHKKALVLWVPSNVYR